MRYIYCSILFLLLVVQCTPKPPSLPDEGLLWQISGNNLLQPSYLFGTWHGDNAFAGLSFLDSVPHLNTVLNEVSQYIGETATTLPQHRALRIDAMLMDTSYLQLLLPHEVRTLDLALLTYMNTTVKDLHIRPHYVMQILAGEHRQREAAKTGMPIAPIEVMDVALEKYAQQKGYTIVALDDSQCLRLVNRPLRHEIDDLLAMVQHNRYDISLSTLPQLTQALLDAYRRQDMQQIAKESARWQQVLRDSLHTNPLLRPMIDNALGARNVLWMNSIPQLIANRPSLIAVGVQHLPHRDGLINLLQKQGYIVEPMR